MKTTFQEQAVEDLQFSADGFRLGDLLAGGLDFGGDSSAEGVHAGGVAIVFGEIRQHGFENLGIHPSGRVVVQIGHVHHCTSSTTKSGVTNSRSLDST